LIGISADVVNVMRGYHGYTIKKNTGIVIDASKEVDLEVGGEN
jgi:hypothetical protein